MPVIRISDQTWERLKVHATPLEDTPDAVVRRALDALEKVKQKPLVPSPADPCRGPRKSGRGTKLSQKELPNTVRKQS